MNQFVPNDAVFHKDSGRLKILTGPNASGKSVYLKQVMIVTAKSVIFSVKVQHYRQTSIVYLVHILYHLTGWLDCFSCTYRELCTC